MADAYFCPDHPTQQVGKAGKVWFGRQKVQRWRCAIDGKTYTKPILKDAGDYGKPNVALPEDEEETATYTPETAYEPTTPTPTPPSPPAPPYTPPVTRKKRAKRKKSFDDISIGTKGLNIGDISKRGNLDSLSL